MKVDLNKIKKLPPDIKKDFMKMYLKHDQKKKVENINKDFLSFVKHVWPDFIEGYHHKKIADKFNKLADGKIKCGASSPPSSFCPSCSSSFSSTSSATADAWR